MHHYPTFLQIRPDQPEVPSCTTIPTLCARDFSAPLCPHNLMWTPLAHGCFAVATEQSCQHALCVQAPALCHTTLRSYYVGTAPANVIHATTESLGVSEQNAQRQFTGLLLRCVTRHTHIMLQILPIMLCSDAPEMHQLCFVFQPIMLFWHCDVHRYMMCIGMFCAF